MTIAKCIRVEQTVAKLGGSVSWVGVSASFPATVGDWLTTANLLALSRCGGTQLTELVALTALLQSDASDYFARREHHLELRALARRHSVWLTHQTVGRAMYHAADWLKALGLVTWDGTCVSEIVATDSERPLPEIAVPGLLAYVWTATEIELLRETHRRLQEFRDKDRETAQ